MITQPNCTSPGAPLVWQCANMDARLHNCWQPQVTGPSYAPWHCLALGPHGAGHVPTWPPWPHCHWLLQAAISRGQSVRAARSTSAHSCHAPGWRCRPRGGRAAAPVPGLPPVMASQLPALPSAVQRQPPLLEGAPHALLGVDDEHQRSVTSVLEPPHVPEPHVLPGWDPEAALWPPGRGLLCIASSASGSLPAEPAACNKHLPEGQQAGRRDSRRGRAGGGGSITGSAAQGQVPVWQLATPQRHSHSRMHGNARGRAPC